MKTNDIVSENSRPPIEKICYISAEGNPHMFIVGFDGITEIREIGEYGEYAIIPWVEVWAGSRLLARFNQHKLEHIFYTRTPQADKEEK